MSRSSTPQWSRVRPACSTTLMIRLAEECGVSFERCVARSGLTRHELEDPSCEITGMQELEVLGNILRAVDPQVPFALLAGVRYRVTMLGMWGFAVLSSSTLREAVEIGLRYFELSYSFNRVRLELENGEGRFIYDSSDNPEELRAALIERDLGALVEFQREMIGRRIPARALHLRAPRPRYAAEF